MKIQSDAKLNSIAGGDFVGGRDGLVVRWPNASGRDYFSLTARGFEERRMTPRGLRFSTTRTNPKEEGGGGGGWGEGGRKGCFSFHGFDLHQEWYLL